MADTEGVDYDQKGQLDQIKRFVLDGEKLHAVYDCKGAGTGFVAITNKRLIFYDKAFMRNRKAFTSVPFSKVTAVSSVDEGRGLFGATSELVVKTGSEEYEFEFRVGDGAQRSYKLIMGELLRDEQGACAVRDPGGRGQRAGQSREALRVVAWRSHCQSTAHR